MILGPDGKRLSKRHGATSVEAFGELGIVPEGMANFLALLGWSFDGKQELFSLDELARVFTLEKIGANPAVFDTQKLEWVNGQHLKRLDEAERTRRVVAFLAARGRDLAGRSDEWKLAFVRALGERLRTLADAETIGAFALDDDVRTDEAAWADLSARPGAADRLLALATRLEGDPEYSLASLEALTRSLATELGMKAGELIGMARVALTGQKTSPGIFEVLWLVGRERAVARLRGTAARLAAEPRSPMAT
jgi:glutamyl-tRNA synthetase